MDLVARAEFLEWAAGRAIVPDPPNRDQQVLTYVPERRHWRFWAFDRDNPAELERFFQRVVEGLWPWSSCYVWPRNGVWQGDDVPRSRVESMRAALEVGPLVPDGFAGAIHYDGGERAFLVNRLVRRARVAWCTHDDLFVVPDHAERFLWLDHHDVVVVKCADGDGVSWFIRHMEDGGYRLPEVVPDATFRKPYWMT